MAGKRALRSITIGVAITPPGGGPPLYVHHRDNEVFIMECGDIEVNVEGERKKAPPGSVVFLPKGIPHQFQNAGQAPSRHWVITTPSGFETFFERCAEIFAKGGTPDMGQIMQVCADHGYQVLSPPPGQSASAAGGHN